MFSQKYTEKIGNMWLIMINPQKPVINLIKNLNHFTALVYIRCVCVCVYMRFCRCVLVMMYFVSVYKRCHSFHMYVQEGFWSTAWPHHLVGFLFFFWFTSCNEISFVPSRRRDVSRHLPWLLSDGVQWAWQAEALLTVRIR